MKKNSQIVVLYLFLIIPFLGIAQYSKIEQHILLNQLDSAKIVLKNIPKTDYTSVLGKIIDKNANNSEYHLFMQNTVLLGKSQILLMDDFINSNVKPFDNKKKIDLDYVKIKWLQLHNLSNEALLEEARNEHNKFSKYVNSFDSLNTDVQKAKIYLNTQNIVFHLINGEKVGYDKCLADNKKAVALKDTFLIVMTLSYMNDFLITENKLDEYIENCKKALALEENSKVKTAIYQPMVEYLIDALIYKGDFDVEYVEKVLLSFYNSPNKRNSYFLYIKFLNGLDVKSTTAKKIFTQFGVNNLVSLCDTMFIDLEHNINLNEFYYFTAACVITLSTHKYYDDAIRYTNYSMNLNKNIYTEELSKSLANFQTQKLQHDTEIQIQAEKQKSIYLGIFLGVSILFIMVVSVFLINIRKKSAILSIRNKEKELLLKEIHHRVKNNFQMIISFMRLQEKYTREISIEKFILQLEMKMNSMAMVHEMLYKDQNLEKIELKKYIDELINYILDSVESNESEIEYDLNGDVIYLNLEQAIPISLILNELITNSIKHNPIELLKISISLNSENKNFIIKFKDNGKGLPENFTIEKSTSLGLKLIYILTDQLNGKIEHLNDKGALFKLTIPNK